MKTALITGITGQDGSYLAELLIGKGYRVIGLVSRQHSIGEGNISHLKDKLTLCPGDLIDQHSLEKVILKHCPDEIYNLGGITFVPTAWDKPVLTFDINALGPVRMLEIIRDRAPKTRYYQASTAKIFGDPKENPQTENTPIAPDDPYGISKACAHFSVQQFRRHFGLFAVSGILYNHESERRGEEFVTRKITLGAAKIKLGLEDNLALGNLEAKQDWGYAPDYVEAMWRMLQHPQADDFIIATGKLHSVREVCEIAFDEAGLDWKKYVVRDPRFYRKEIPTALTGNAAKAGRILGWKPKVGFDKMIRKMVAFDLHKLQQTNPKS